MPETLVLYKIVVILFNFEIIFLFVLKDTPLIQIFFQTLVGTRSMKMFVGCEKFRRNVRQGRQKNLSRSKFKVYGSRRSMQMLSQRSSMMFRWELFYNEGHLDKAIFIDTSILPGCIPRKLRWCHIDTISDVGILKCRALALSTNLSL